ncbi:unnamed protein product [Rhizophagus irregularis]|nr:unnamed protein product [Rhizophagus irregularis]
MSYDKRYKCKKCDELCTYINYNWCKQCQIKDLKRKFINWTSRDEKIDNFIREKQLEINSPQNTILEWIPYDQFSDINEVNNDNLSTVYSAKWKNGPLYWDENIKEYKYYQNNEITLKCLHNLQNNEEFLNEVKVHSINFKIYGISQCPSNIKDYIIVLQDRYCNCIKCNKAYTNITNKWCKQCQINNLKKDFVNWTSGDEKIDNFIQEKQLEIDSPQSTILEWIPYDQFSEINEVDNNDLFTVNSAIWKNGPLDWDKHKFLNEVKVHSINFRIYGISRCPNIKDYIIVLQNKNCYCIKCNKAYANITCKWCKQCQTNNLKKDFINWTSGSEKIDNFIKEKQLLQSTIIEWIPYNQFSDINEVNNDDLSTVYSAKLKNGPIYRKKYIKKDNNNQNNEITLKHLHNLQNIEEFLNEVKIHSINFKIYGISQFPNIKDYIIVLQDRYYFINWTSGDKKIDTFIQEKQLEIDSPQSIILKWIPYDQFSDINEVNNDDLSIVYSAKWKDDHILDENIKIHKSYQNNKITLKYLHNLQNNEEFLNEVKVHSINFKIYGISQFPDIKDYIIVLQDRYCYCIKCNKAIQILLANGKNNWKLIAPQSIILKWIPYDQFSDINEVNNDNLSIIYSAKWKNGPIYWDKILKNTKIIKITKITKVTLKYLRNLQNIEEFIMRLRYIQSIFKLHGISQILNTKDYILVLIEDFVYGNYCIKCNKGYTDIIGKWCRKCQINNFRKDFANWTSGNDKIDNFIQEKQLEINSSQSIIFEWILYDQFSEINEVDNNDFSIVYSAKRKNSPLYWDENCKKYKRHQDNKNNEVTLKYLHNLQHIEEFLNEVKVHSNYFEVYGISQNSNTKDYILVLIDFNYGNYCINCNNGYTDAKSKWCRQCQINNLKKDFINWTSGNEKINNFIQEKQLEIDSPQSIILECIPYNQFSEINEVDYNYLFTAYSAIWKNGPLDWDKYSKKYKRHQDKNNEVVLKYLHNLQNIEEFLNEVKASTKFNIYGISPIPNIKDYIIVLQDKDYCIKCNEAYTNITCKCSQSTILEWIPYDQFSDINEVNNDDLSIVYSAKWKNGPLHWDENCRKYKRHQDNKNNEVTLKYLHNLQNIEEFLNEVKVHSTNFKVYGISQIPNTKDYILVLIDFNDGNYCIKCNKGYTDVKSKWCRQCQINNLKKNFINWTSGNEKINNFIQEKQLKINDSKSIVSEWIPYDQFYEIDEVVNNDFFTVYSAIQKNGLFWDKYSKKYKKYHKSVALKYLHNLQNIEEFLNEV